MMNKALRNVIVAIPRITRELYHELMMPNRKFSPPSKSP
jgi:hypothetical protein